MSKLKLDRPIVFLDIESTGLDTQLDRIVELCVCKVTPANEYITKTYRYNPGIEIPEAATAIHGITNEMVKDCPAFSQHAKGIMAALSGKKIKNSFLSKMYNSQKQFNQLMLKPIMPPPLIFEGENIPAITKRDWIAMLMDSKPLRFRPEYGAVINVNDGTV